MLAVREQTGAAVEVLTPDFIGKPGRDRARRRSGARSLQPQHRDRAAALPRRARPQERLSLDARPAGAASSSSNPAIKTKSGLMLGLGETHEELFDTLADLRDAGCDFLTLGQYLQPTPKHLPVVRYLPPEEFDELGRARPRLGF